MRSSHAHTPAAQTLRAISFANLHGPNPMSPGHPAFDRGRDTLFFIDGAEVPRELLRRGGGGGGGDIGGLPFPFEVHRGVHLLVSARGCVTWRVYDTYASAADADALARALRDDIPRGALFAMSIEDDGSAEFTPRLLAAVRALAAESGCASGPSQPTFRGAWCMVGQRGSNCYFRARPPLPPELQGGRSVLPAACPEFWVDLSVTGALDGAAPLLTPVAAAVSARVSGGGGEGGGGTGLDDGAAWPPPSPAGATRRPATSTACAAATRS